VAQMMARGMAFEDVIYAICDSIDAGYDSLRGDNIDIVLATAASIDAYRGCMGAFANALLSEQIAIVEDLRDRVLELRSEVRELNARLLAAGDARARLS